MRLALDAMGGDHAPLAMVEGAVDYARATPAHHVILVGRQDDVAAALAKQGPAPANISIEHAPDVIGMAEKLEAFDTKPNDSMRRCADLVKSGGADAMVLCGNTGCSVGIAQMRLRRVPGVKRAGILVPLPKTSGRTYLIDGGANAVGKPEHLVQFAEMTTQYLEVVLGKKRPGVGVLSIGEEDEKGIELTQETLALLRKTDLNVLGNVEGHDIYRRPDLDIVVCDGFTGNIVLKTSEGVVSGIQNILKEEIYRSWRTKLGGWLMKPAFEGLRRRTHWSMVGGCPLLGVDGVTIIGHGRSNRTAVENALRQAEHCVQTRMMDALRARFRAAAASITASAPVVAE